MATFASVMTIAILIALMYGGYRFNMYLYTHKALGVNTRRMPLLEEREAYTASREEEVALVRVRDYGLHYARTGILIFAVLVVLILLVLVTLVSSVF